MPNAKVELLGLIGRVGPVKAMSAVLTTREAWEYSKEELAKLPPREDGSPAMFGDRVNVEVALRVGFSPADLEAVLAALDVEYDAGYGSQKLYGEIWFQDGTWATRGEYDGSEWWQHHSCPEIPAELR